jgi:hypothetical protein
LFGRVDKSGKNSDAAADWAKMDAYHGLKEIAPF